MKKRVLTVDDEEVVAETIKLILESTDNYEVKILSDAKNILSAMHSFKPDVILLDLIMPDIGGLEVCEMLNKDPMGMTIPIIVLSALVKDADKIKAFKLGVESYLEKPIKKDLLIEGIEKAIKLKNQPH